MAGPIRPIAAHQRFDGDLEEFAPHRTTSYFRHKRKQAPEEATSNAKTFRRIGKLIRKLRQHGGLSYLRSRRLT